MPVPVCGRNFRVAVAFPARRARVAARSRQPGRPGPARRSLCSGASLIEGRDGDVHAVVAGIVRNPHCDVGAPDQVQRAARHIAELVSATCAVFAEPDGIEFDRASIEASRIKEDADYEGVRVRFHATLAKARIQMQIDIGLGDVIVRGPTEIEYPTLLDFPAPVLQAYPRESGISESSKR